MIAGILILIVPRLLNYIVAIYLILVGLAGLNGIYHFINDTGRTAAAPIIEACIARPRPWSLGGRAQSNP